MRDAPDPEDRSLVQEHVETALQTSDAIECWSKIDEYMESNLGVGRATANGTYPLRLKQWGMCARDVG